MNHSPPRPRIEPRFFGASGQRLFALQLSPEGEAIGNVLYLPPYAEEMNRLRSHASATARALASCGWRCLLLDPYGTGESDGATEEATWQRWQGDAVAALQWLGSQGSGPMVLWGARAGALLANDVARSHPSLVSHLLYWQPVVDGALYLNQYLRLRVASQVVSDAEKETTESIRRRLAAGETLEIAGYPLSPAMADALAVCKLEPSARGGPPTDWIEIIGKPDQSLPPASKRWIDGAKERGADIRVAPVVAPMIWQIHGREDAPTLLDATVQALMHLAGQETSP